MKLKEFVNKYLLSVHRLYVGDLFKCKFDEDEGLIIPEGFSLLNNISRVPLFIIAVNRDEKAIIKFDGDVSLLIYDTEVQMEAAISLHEEYFKNRFERHLNLKSFCDSITTLELMELIDAITNEFYTTEQMEEKSKKKDVYMEDLMVLLRLFTNTTFPKNKVRINFIRDAYPLLRKLEKNLISIQSMNLVKIADVYYTQSDETYYVLKKDYERAYEYIADNLEQTKKLLIDDNWKQIGKIDRWDEVLVEAYSKDNKIIAIWDDVIQ